MEEKYTVDGMLDYCSVVQSKKRRKKSKLSSTLFHCTLYDRTAVDNIMLLDGPRNN